jgi:peptide/nickel transport system permease protein
VKAPEERPRSSPGHRLAARVRSSLRQAREAWTVFAQNRLALAGLALGGVFVLLALVHPILLATVWEPRIYDQDTGYEAPVKRYLVVEEVTDPSSQLELNDARFQATPYAEVGDIVEVRLQPAPPSGRHLLGTDFLGRDVLSMVMASAAPTLVLGLAAAITTAIVGTMLAAVSAYYRGAADAVIGQVSNTLLLLPAPIVMVVAGARFEIGPLMFGILYGVVAGAGPAAIVLRSHALSVMGRPFIDAARAAGARGPHIIGRHLVPNLAPLAAAHVLVAVTGAVVADGFLGWSALSATRLNWGVMISSAIFFAPLEAEVAWHVFLPAALAISLFCGAFYLMSLGLRDVADRSLRRGVLQRVRADRRSRSIVYARQDVGR